MDQLCQGMIFFVAGHTQVLKRFLMEEGIGRNPLFRRSVQALSARYPSNTDQKRWVNIVLARKKIGILKKIFGTLIKKWTPGFRQGDE